MPLKFDAALAAVMDKVFTMGAMAERMVNNVIATLVERNLERLKPVYEDEEKMDQLQREVDDATVEMIGVFTPVAADLRVLLMIARINGEIERVGDQAVNICHIVESLLGEEPLKPLEDIPEAATQALDMLRRSLKAFAEKSLKEAVSVMKKDDQVDGICDALFKELLGYMDRDTHNVHRALGLLLISRAVERVADHAVNIAEDTVYMITGKDIRHLRPGDEGYPALPG